MTPSTETLTATCDDHDFDIEMEVRVRAGKIPAAPDPMQSGLLESPAENVDRRAAHPDDVLDGWPTCPACEAPMVVERNGGGQT